MGKSLEKIAYTILEKYTNFATTDDEALDIEIIYDKIHDTRIFLMNEEISKFKRLNSAFYSICDCNEILCGPVVCGEYDSDVIRYYADVKFIEESLGKFAIRYLGTPDFKNNYRHLNFPFGASGRWTKHVPAYAWVDGKIIFEQEPDFKLFTTVAITKSGGCGDNCDVTAEYNIPGDLISKLEDIVLNGLFPSYKIKRDDKNNTADDV